MERNCSVDQELAGWGWGVEYCMWIILCEILEDLTAASSRVPTSQITSTTGSAKTLGQLTATGPIPSLLVPL